MSKRKSSEAGQLFPVSLAESPLDVPSTPGSSTLSLESEVINDLSKKGKPIAKRSTGIPNEALVGNPSYGAGTRSYHRSLAHGQLAKERRRVTEAYERGELRFDGELPLLCYCGGMFSTSYQWIAEAGVGHPIHKEELERFNSEHKSKNNRKKKRGRRLVDTSRNRKSPRRFRS